MERPSGSAASGFPTGQEILRRAYKASEAMNGWGETIAWWNGYVYTGHTVSKLSKGWRLVVRADSPNGKAMVKIVYAPTVTDCVWIFNRSLITRGLAEWQKDKYAG